MNTVVTARVPVEVKNQTDKKLKQLGLSTTALINAAYRYVLDHGCLPGEDVRAISEDAPPKVKALTPQQAQEHKALWSKRAVLKATQYDGTNFKELLNDARDEYYARFA